MFSYVIFAGFVITLFLFAILIAKKDKTGADRFLTAFFALSSLFFLAGFRYVRGFSEYDGLLLVIGNLLIVPLLYGYIYLMLGGKGRLKGHILLLYTPLMLTLIVAAAAIVFLSETELGTFFDFRIRGGNPYALIVITLDTLILPAALCPLLLRFKHFSKELKESFSDRKSVDFRWIKYFLIAEGVTWLFLTVGNVLVDLLAWNEKIMLLPSMLAVPAVFAVFLGFYGIHETDYFTKLKAIGLNSPQPAKRKRGTYTKSGLTSVGANEIERKLAKLMEEQKCYLEASFNLAQLSGLLNIPAGQISETLNVHMNTTFYNYINRLRIQEVCSKIDSGEAERVTLLALAFDSGFNSKATFNRIFRTETGVTPSQYRNRINR